MEPITILLSTLMALISPVNGVSERLIQNAVRSQFAAVEQLQVRVDNAPNYQLVQGRVDRLRIAARGLFPIADVRLEALELETDPINLNVRRLQRGKFQIQQPLRAGMRLVIREADINRALQSPDIQKRIQKLSAEALRDRSGGKERRYELLNPQVEFLDDQRLRIQVNLRQVGEPDILQVLIETGLEVIAGRQFQLVNPIIKLDGETVPKEVLTSISNGFTEQSDLRQFEQMGITARVLQLKLDGNHIDAAAFVQFAPQNP